MKNQLLFALALLTFSFASAQNEAPDFLVDGEWFNTEALSIEDLRGQVVLGCVDI